MVLTTWTIADICFSNGPEASENLLRLQAEGCNIRYLDAFLLPKQMTANELTTTGLVIMSNICHPHSDREVLRDFGRGGLGFYNSQIFAAVKESLPNAMIIMLTRESDRDVRADVILRCTGPLLSAKMEDMPFDFRPKACNHTSEEECILKGGANQWALVSPGSIQEINKIALGSLMKGTLSVIKIVERATASNISILWLGEWDAALSFGCSQHINEQTSVPIPIRPKQFERRRWGKGEQQYTYEDFLDWVIFTTRPYDSPHHQGLFAAMMWTDQLSM